MTYENSPIMRRMTLAFLRVEAAIFFPAAVGLAMSACESGWWKSVTGDFNYWGKTRAPEQGPAKFCPTSEHCTKAELRRFRADELATMKPKLEDIPDDGQKHWVTMSRWFASYASLEESLQDFVALITGGHNRYATAWQQYLKDRNADGLLTRVCDAGYATGDAKTVELQILHQANIIHAVAAGRDELLANPAA